MAYAGDSRAAEEVVKEHEERVPGTGLQALRESPILPVHPHIEEMCKSIFKRLPMYKKEKNLKTIATYLCCFQAHKHINAVS